MAAVQDDAVQGGAIVLAFASYSMATDVALALVIVLALAIVLALQSAIEPNFIPPEIKQRALPQTRPYDDCVAIFDIVPDGVSGFVEIDIVVVVQQWQNSLLLDGPPLSTEDLKALTNSRSDAGTHTLPS